MSQSTQALTSGNGSTLTLDALVALINQSEPKLTSDTRTTWLATCLRLLHGNSVDDIIRQIHLYIFRSGMGTIVCVAQLRRREDAA